MKLVNFLPENLYQFSLKLQWGGQTYLTIQWKTRVTLLSTLRVYEDYVSKTFCLKKKKKKERNYPTVVFGMCPWQPVASHPVCLNKKVFRSNLLIQAVSHE